EGCTGARPPSGLPRALLHGRGEGVLRFAPEPAAALRGPVRRQGGGRQGARRRRPVHVAGDRDRGTAEAGRPSERVDEGGGGAARRRGDRPVDDALEGARGGDLRRFGRTPVTVGLEPLYTAAEMRAAEERYPGWPGTVPELMERAGRAVAQE